MRNRIISTGIAAQRASSYHHYYLQQTARRRSSVLLLFSPQAANESPDPQRVEVILTLRDRVHVIPAIVGANARIAVDARELQEVATQSVVVPSKPAHSDAIAEFEDLLNHPASSEADFQALMERRPMILLGSDYARLHPHVVLMHDGEDDLIPDFLLEPIQGMNHEPQIVDLKLPWTDVIKPTPRREGLYASVMDGVNQLHTYREYFREESNREYVREKLGFTAYRPQLVLVIGRAVKATRTVRSRVFSAIEPIQLRTYEDLLLRLKAQADREGAGSE